MCIRRVDKIRFKLIWAVFLCVIVFGCSANQNVAVYNSETLIINQISDHTYQHISYLQTEDYGKVACNGIIVVDQKEAIVFDTPSDNDVSVELINWLGRELRCRVEAVVPTHFHEDCLGGLEAFHIRGIPSYANQMTIQLADTSVTLPQVGFEDRLELKVGEQKVFVDYLGEGHTKDNVVGYFPSEKVLFGGCLVKSLKAGKGYLGDANVEAWPETISKIKSKYPDIESVISGHGNAGGADLLDYTIEVFSSRKE